MASEEKVREVKNKHSAQLLSLPGVSGVGISKAENGELVLTLHLDADDPEREALLPKEIEGVPVQIVHSGPFQKY
jgi:hypothetical protein